MKKGDVCEGIIERYDFPNKGSFQVDERKVTIKGALPDLPQSLRDNLHRSLRPQK